MVTVNPMVFDAEHSAENRQPVCALLRKPDLSGNPSWPFASLIARAVDDHRSILLDASPAAPIQAALEILALPTAGIQRIEDPEQWFAEFAHSQVPVVYHWFVALYPEVNTVPLGQPHHQLREWILVQLRRALSLVREAALEAVVLIYPHHLPDPVTSTVQRAMSTSEWQGWQRRSLTLRNHAHGGPIETEHDVTVFLPVQVAANFHFPEFTEDPQPLAVALNKDTYAYDALWLKNGLEVRKPTLLHQAMTN